VTSAHSPYFCFNVICIIKKLQATKIEMPQKNKK